MICEATVFLLFWLHLDSQSFKIVRKPYLPHPAFSSFLLGWCWCKQTLKLLLILHLGFLKLFIHNYYWPEQFIPWVSRKCYWSNFYLEVAEQSMLPMSAYIIQMMFAMFRDCLISCTFTKCLTNNNLIYGSFYLIQGHSQNNWS